jgi:hypothetical protein
MGLYSPLIEQSHSTPPRRRRTSVHQRKQRIDAAWWFWFATAISFMTLVMLLVWGG